MLLNRCLKLDIIAARIFRKTVWIAGTAMLVFNRDPAVVSYLIAGFMAIVVPMGLGYVVLSDPGACFDSPCALPQLLPAIPPYAAPVLTSLFAINRRFERSLPDGWLPTILASGIVGQIVMSAFGVVMASLNIPRIFFSDILLDPQGLFVGLVVGVVFWVVLHGRGRGSDDEPRTIARPW